MHIWMRVFLLAAMIGIVSVPSISDAQNDAEQKRADEVKLVEGLRQRRLFDLAERFCRQQLASPNLDPTTQATIVVELIKTQTSRAIMTPADRRAAQWGQVQTTADEFLNTNLDHPRKFLIEVQVALSHLAHGRLLRQEIAADMAPESARDLALKEIQSARNLLVDLQREIDKAIPEQRARPLQEHDLSVQQLMTLTNNIRFQLAVCNASRAQLYEANDRLNRIDALNSVSQRLVEVQRQTSEGQPLWWKTKLGQLECLRLLGKLGEAHRLMEVLLSLEVPRENWNALIEQKARLAIELGDANFSQSVFEDVEKSDYRSAQLELALIELSVDMAARSRTDAEKRRWMDFGSNAARAIEVTHGAYWGRRADLVLIESAGGIPNSVPDRGPVKMTPPKSNGASIVSAELDQLIRLAEDAERKERWNDAVKAFDFASAKAVALGSNEMALRLDIRAGKILERNKNHVEAARRLMDAANKYRDMPLAGSAHLRGCWNFAKTLSKATPEKKKELETRLTNHVNTWPKDKSSNQARIWLAGQFQNQQQWQSAIDQYLNVTVDSPHLKPAIQQTYVCANAMLARIRQSGKPTRSFSSGLEKQLAAKQVELPITDSVGMLLQLYRVELDLVYGSNRPFSGLVKNLIAIESSSSGDAALQNRARAMLAVSICLDDPKQAKQVLGQIGSDLVSLESGDRCLSAVAKFSSAQTDRKAALDLRLAGCSQALQTPALASPGNAKQETQWLMRKSETLTELGRHAEAVVVLAELEKRFPKSASIKMQLARAMTEQLRNSDPAKPLAQWREVAARLKSGTANWYEAKYMVASLLLETGQTAEAAKLLKYINVIPGWKDSDYGDRFDRLLKQATAGT